MEFLSILIGFLLGVVLNRYIYPYLSKKAENLATKEDIEGITDKIEATKKIYSQELETVKHELAKSLNAHSVAFKYEFESLVDIWSAVIDLRESALKLRPVIEYVDSSISEEERMKKKLQEYYDALQPAWFKIEKLKPFFPKDIYDKLGELIAISNGEMVAFRRGEDKSVDYWEKALENSEKIKTITDEVEALIRKRYNDEYEKLRSEDADL